MNYIFHPSFLSFADDGVFEGLFILCSYSEAGFGSEAKSIKKSFLQGRTAFGTLKHSATDMMGLLASIVICCCALAATCALGQEHGEEYEKTMGPVAFLWPPDREWGAAQDNTAPCGSTASVVNRTEYPLRKLVPCPDDACSFSPVNGQIALVAQDESWYIQVAISHKNGG